MRRAIIILTAIVFTFSKTANSEESEFSKELQRIAAHKAWELTEELLNEVSKGSPSESAPTRRQPMNRGLRMTSYWDHNGSTMALLVEGNTRIFVYVKPRAGLKGAVQPGMVLFSGISDDSEYSGRARRFSPGLDPVEYSVSGPIERGGSRVTLTGKAIVRNRDGSIKKTFDDVLTFDLISSK